jgi:hypothetical protein
MTITAQADDFDSLRELAGERLAAIADLYYLSWNYDFPGPYIFFLDLIGYSEENFGTRIYDYSKMTTQLQHSELDYLADALKCYALRPQDVEDFINKLEMLEH